jgi:hypothetical protein
MPVLQYFSSDKVLIWIKKTFPNILKHFLLRVQNKLTLNHHNSRNWWEIKDLKNREHDSTLR